MSGKAQRIVGRVHPEPTYAVHVLRVGSATLVYYVPELTRTQTGADNICVASGLTEAEAHALVALIRSGANNG